MIEDCREPSQHPTEVIVVRISAPNPVQTPSVPRSGGAATTPTTSVDTCDIGAKVVQLQKRAEKLHGLGDGLGIATLFGAPLYVPAAMGLSSLVGMDGMGGAMLFSLGIAGGIVAASMHVSYKANEVRAEAEALNKANGAPSELHWNWALTGKN